MHFRCRGNPLEKNSFFNFSATKWKDCQKEKCKRFGVVAGQLRHFDGSDVPRSRKKKKKKRRRRRRRRDLCKRLCGRSTSALPWLYILSRGCASGMNVSLRVERHRATLGNIPGFHLVRPTVSRGGTQDTVISPSSLLLLVYIQIFGENRERNPSSKFPFLLPKISFNFP